MNTQTKTERIAEVINNMTGGELISINNVYCDHVNNPDGQIYDNDEEFFSIFYSNNIIGAVQAATYGDYSYGHNFVKFNGYGNLDSFNCMNVDQLCDSVSVISEDIEESPADYMGISDELDELLKDRD